MKRVFLAADYDKLVRAEEERGSWQVTRPLHGVRVNDLCADPANPRLVYAATQQEGLLRSSDSGKTWQSIGLRGTPVKSLALSPGRPGVIYAGCKPVSLYVTDDAGGTWQELPAMRRSRRWWWFSPADPPGMTPYVQALAVSPQNPDVIMAGIELGGVLRSTDGGRTWSRHRPGAVLDCHSLIFHHHQGSWVYAGGGGGVSFSQDGGLTWRKHRDGLKKIYVWMVAADPQKPEV